MRHRAWCTGLLLVVLMLTGCDLGAGGPTAVPAPTPAAVFSTWRGCAEHVSAMELFESNDRPAQGRVPDGFRATQAIRCEQDASQSDEFIGAESHATDIDGLIAELARPSESSVPMSAGMTCLDWGWQRPWLFLVDPDGRWIMPQVPADSCSHPLEPEKGNSPPSWRRVDTWPLDLSERQRIWDIGCLPRIRVEAILTDAGVGNDHREAIPAGEISGPITALCRYRVGRQLHPNMAPEGHLITPRAVTPREGELIRSAIISEPANRCQQVATTFVTLEGVGDTIEVAVELDGCRRMLQTYSSDGPLRAGATSNELLALVGN